MQEMGAGAEGRFEAERSEIGRYLEDTIVVDWQTPAVCQKAGEIARPIGGDEEGTVRALFEWVRDEIAHSFEIETDVVTCNASQVLREGTGLCFAKSHLLAALLRARGIPAGFGYQRLRREEPAQGFALHGFALAYLAERERWVVLDALGRGGDAQTVFRIDPPSLAHTPDAERGESTWPLVFARPARSVVDVLSYAPSLARIRDHLPDRIG